MTLGMFAQIFSQPGPVNNQFASTKTVTNVCNIFFVCKEVRRE